MATAESTLSEIIYQSTDHVALTPEGWPIITRAFFTGRNSYIPDIKEIEVEVGDTIFICSDGVYGNGKWNYVKDVLLDGDTFDSLNKIKKIIERNANDNYSAILVHLQF